MLRCAVAVALLASEALGSAWTYDRCGKVEPPEEWPDTCSVQTQGSPINLCGAQKFAGAAPNLVATGYGLFRSITILNNGHTIQIAPSGPGPTLQVGTLPAIVGRGNSTDALTYQLEQTHFHWGREGHSYEGSEHFVQGKRYPLEVHLVHFNTAAGTSVATALASGRKDALLVVGVVFQIGNSEPDIVKTVAAQVSTATAKATAVNDQVKFSDLFDGSGGFYSYAGSLTTPPCTEAVTWVVMTDIKTVTLGTLNTFKGASAAPAYATSMKFVTQSDTAGELISKYGNFRPLQELNNRTIYLSAGTSADCTEVVQPAYTCGAAGVQAGSLLLSVMVALLALLWL